MLGDRMYEIKGETMRYPITSLTWKPCDYDEGQDRQKLLGATLEGGIVRWTSVQGDVVEHIRLNESQKYHAIDYSADRRRFCIAGTLPQIEIYNEERMTCIQQLGDRIHPAHSNKIFCCKFNVQAPNMIISGSWDRQVRFWDVRANKLIQSIGSKTQTCGDSIDVSYCGNLVVTGGGTLGEGLAMWDFRDLSKPIINFAWDHAPNGDLLNPVINCARFIPRQHLILAGASDDPVPAKCFDTNTGGVIKEFPNVTNNCFSLDIAYDGQVTALGDGNGTLHFENISYGF